MFCEGATAAAAAAARLPAEAFDVLAFVSSSVIPNPTVLQALVGGRDVVVWPDDDDPGAKVATRLSAALTGIASRVRRVSPAALGLTGSRGDDAAQWRPGDDPAADLHAAAAAEVGPAPKFKSLWDYTEEPTPVVLIPGLAWRGRVTKITSAPKLGKTSLVACGIAGLARGPRVSWRAFTGPPGRVLYVSETPVGVLRAWITRYGCPGDAPIIAGGSASVGRSRNTRPREHQPDLVIIDSLTDLHAASDSGNLWKRRRRAQVAANRSGLLGCAVVLIHHVRKSDGASRDSGDLEAAPDMNVKFDPGFSFGGDDPPPGPRRLRYSGRWPEPERKLAFSENNGYSLDTGSGGAGSDDPFTTGDPMVGKILDYLLAHPEGSSLRAIRAAVPGRAAGIDARLKDVGVRSADGKWQALKQAMGGPKTVGLETQNTPRPEQAMGGPKPVGLDTQNTPRPEQARGGAKTVGLNIAGHAAS